jgi:hypothetical protein
MKHHDTGQFAWLSDPPHRRRLFNLRLPLSRAGRGTGACPKSPGAIAFTQMPCAHCHRISRIIRESNLESLCCRGPASRSFT